jgi:hydroxylamine dehydrogenase
MNTRKWITLIALAFVLLLALSACGPTRVLPQGATAQQAAAFEALYKSQMPWQYEQWKQSAHGKAGVTCINCHDVGPDGKIKSENLDNLAYGGVKPERCGKCHEKELNGWKQTRHSEAVKLATTNVRYKLLDGFPAMQRQGCQSCHFKVGTTCISCHDVHLRQAEASGMQEPNCATCHTKDDNKHEIFRIKDVQANAALNVKANNRQLLEAKCWRCHSPEFTAAALKDSDAIKAEANRIVDAGRAIVRDLYVDGILKPSYGSLLDDKGVPLLNAKGTSYSHVSEIENLMFELFKFAQATTERGAQHFSPDYVHWHGNADLWAKYLAVRNEAIRLRWEHEGQGMPIEQFEQDLIARKPIYAMYAYSNQTGHELDDLKK